MVMHLAYSTNDRGRLNAMRLKRAVLKRAAHPPFRFTEDFQGILKLSYEGFMGPLSFSIQSIVLLDDLFKSMLRLTPLAAAPSS